jgi:predicted O-methyltransferase YrrM
MFLLDFYAEHRTRIRPGEYADLTTALWAIAELAAPRSYLEIGVRRGRSLSVVASLRPEIDVVGIDLWLPDYAGMSNPGEEFVRAELAKIGHRGRLDLITGNSHLILPRYLSQHPDQFFDLIVVDGDHTRRGASLDLRNVLPRLAIGGLVVFDDIVHPSHPYLGAVWNRYVGASPRFAVWEYRDTGFGVGIGLRKF